MKSILVLGLMTLFASSALAQEVVFSYDCELTRPGPKGRTETCVVSGERTLTTPLSMSAECTDGFELEDSDVEGFIGAPLGSNKAVLHSVEDDNEAYLHIKGDEPIDSGVAARLYTSAGFDAETYVGVCTLFSLPAN